ncbi:MAG: menaquinone reductase molybdopterin-binding-like subunit QrcB [Desulfobacterales bacterium]
MKIDRRSFLSLGIGAAAGTALSPLPWKLTDDLSIWTQQWPWTPKPEDGRSYYVRTTCTLCPGGCGIAVRKIDDRAVKIEGMKKHPMNNGGVCILGASGLQFLYGPARIQSPLKRIGKRGEGRFEPISWNQAMSELADKLNTMRSEGKPHTLACISGTKNGTVAELIKRFFTAYGSSNFMYVPSIADTYAQTIKMMHGIDAAAGIDVEHADYILGFSSGVLEGWGPTVRMYRANSRLKSTDGTLTQIEPRLSSTAAKADKWIPIVPGTEGILALGLCHVIIQEYLYNSRFVDSFSTGFEGFKRHVLVGYSPDKVAEKTRVEPSVIIALARDFARAEHPVALCGRGEGDTPGDLGGFVAVHALNALVGNINRKGGVWTVPHLGYIQWDAVRPDETALRGLQHERIDGAGGGLQADSVLNRLPEAITQSKGYGIEMLLVSGANPIYTMRDTSAVIRAFDKIGAIVNFSSYMDETVLYSDLVLPNHAYLERYEDVPAPDMFHKPFIGLSQPVVKPVCNTRHTGDVIIETAARMKGTIAEHFKWPSYETCLQQTMGHKWGAMKKNGYWIDSGYTPPQWTETFEMLPRKFNFSASIFKNPVLIAPEGDPGDYPLLLIPFDSIRITNGAVVNPPFMTKTVSEKTLEKNDVYIEINPETAAGMGLGEGARVRLTTPRGSVNVKVHLFPGIGPGIVSMTKGLGHWNNDRYIAGKGKHVNRLIGPRPDPVTGLDAAWGIRAKLAKL